MSEATVDGTIARVESNGRVLSGGTDSDQLAETMERHAPEPEPAGGTTAKDQAVETGSPVPTPAPSEKPTRGQARFSELAKARDAEKARADAAEARAKELEARVAAPPPAREPEPAPVAAKPAAPAEKFTFPSFDAYLETHPNAGYNEWEVERLVAFGDWKDARTDYDGRIRQAISATEAARHADAVVTSTRAKGREAYADFDAVMTNGPGASVNLGPTEDQAKQRCAMIFHHPQSEHLQYAIMKDGALAQKLAGLDDISFGMELARLVPTQSPAPERRAFTPPPAPMQPVNGNSATVSTPSSELAKKGDFDAYRSKRAAERGVKPRY
jgi:hypothetical protein